MLRYGVASRKGRQGRKGFDPQTNQSCRGFLKTVDALLPIPPCVLGDLCVRHLNSRVPFCSDMVLARSWLSPASSMPSGGSADRRIELRKAAYFLKSDLRRESEEVAGFPYKTPLVSLGAGGAETVSAGGGVLLGCWANSPGVP